MLAIRSVLQRAFDARELADTPVIRPDPADWLNVQQAACELNVSVGTLRRMIRKGKLRNRIVPRRGGYAYLIYLPNSRHARGLAHPDSPPALRLVRHRDETTPVADAERVRLLEEQVEHLSEALARTLRLKQSSLPEGMGDPHANSPEPYGRYRWLVRRRRWWPFRAIVRLR